MRLVIDIPEDEVNECKMQVDMIKQEGFLIESLNTALKIHVANGKPLEEELQEIRQEIADYKDDKIIHEERNEMIDIILELIDDKIKEYTE